jgi:hypothetical protein
MIVFWGSRLGLKTGYFEWGFPWFSLVNAGQKWDITSNRNTADPFYVVSISFTNQTV